MKNLNHLLLAGLLATTINPGNGSFAKEAMGLPGPSQRAGKARTAKEADESSGRPCRCSIFETISYDSGTQVLTLAFNNSYGYRYYGVPPLVYRDLVNAPSPGAFYNQQIRRVFKCQRISPAGRLEGADSRARNRTSCPYLFAPRSR
jgi:hypothetical protein